MSEPLKHRVLVVDDEESIRDIFTQLLRHGGYEVETAENGFEALLKLKEFLPKVIVSDLNMPKMSGFEFLSVVRRRFPGICVIASSGAYEHKIVPTGVLADGFYAKGHERPGILVDMVTHLIQTCATQATSHRLESAPVWIPRNGKDSNGIPYIVITCTECLRSFPLNVTKEENPEVLTAPCMFCSNPVKYIIDFSRSVHSPTALSTASADSPINSTASDRFDLDSVVSFDVLISSPTVRTRMRPFLARN